MLRRLLPLTTVVLLLAMGHSDAKAARWSRPVTIVKEPYVNVLDPYFVQSPNGKRIDLVASGTDSRLTLFPRLRDGSYGSPVFVPGDAGALDDDVAINDGGATVAGWSQYTPHPPPGDEYDSCWCRVRAAVRSASGRFGPARDLSAPAPDQPGPSVAVAPNGQATAVWTTFNSSTGHDALRVAQATSDGRFARTHTVAPDVSEFLLDPLSPLPLLVWQVKQQLYEARSPFTRANAIGTLSGSSSLYAPDAGNALDRRGDELRVSADDNSDGTDITASYRRAGADFGPPIRLVHAGPRGTLCDVSDVTNAHAQAFAAWDCDPSGGEGGAGSFAQAAYVSADGHLQSLSRRHPALSAGESVGIALDGRGRALATWQSRGYDAFISLTGAHRRFEGFTRIAKTAQQSATSAGAAIAPGGIALVTWVDQIGVRAQVIKVSSMRMPR